MGPAFLAFLEAVRRGSGRVDADYAGWLMPRDQRELAILDASGAPRVRLPGWVRDEVGDRIAEVIGKNASAKSRARLAELARYYLRPIGSKDLAASRATLSNWRHDAAELVAEELTAHHSTGLAFQLTGLPRKGERLGLEALARDPAVGWILRLHPQERDIAIHRGLADAAGEARDKADVRTLVGVALIASRLAPETNPEPTHDFDGTPLRGLDGRKFTRSRLALPLVLMCLQRTALAARQPGQHPDRHAVLVASHRLVESASRESVSAVSDTCWCPPRSGDDVRAMMRLSRYRPRGMRGPGTAVVVCSRPIGGHREHGGRRARDLDRS